MKQVAERVQKGIREAPRTATTCGVIVQFMGFSQLSLDSVARQFDEHNRQVERDRS